VKQEESDFIARIRSQIQGRMRELEPQIGEAKCLQAPLFIVEYALDERAIMQRKIEKIKNQRPIADKKNFRAWLKTIEPDEVIRLSDVTTRFSASASWSRNQLKMAEIDNILEKWGRGLYRLKPIRTGTARIHLVS